MISNIIYKIKPRCKVILIEDEPVMRLAQERVLESAGFKVTCFNNTEEAEKYMTKVGPKEIDIIITDVFLGDNKRTGLQFAHDLKKRYPIIIISGFDITENIDMVKLYADVFLEKLNAIIHLVRSVEKVLNLKTTEFKKAS